MHSKALELYDTIFAKMGPDILVEDFYIFSIGLLPFFEHSSTVTKPQYFNILENHVFPCLAALKLAWSGLLAALLPGLDDESSEFFKRTFSMLDKMRRVLGNRIFFTELMHIFIKSRRHRLSIVNFLLKGDENECT